MPPSLHTINNIFNDISALQAQSPNTPALTLHIGDISYARGWGYLWEWFMQLIEPVATQTPYMVYNAVLTIDSALRSIDTTGGYSNAAAHISHRLL